MSERPMSLLAGLGREGRSLRRQANVIDCHAHMGPCLGFDCPGSSVEEMVKTMDRVGIEKACVSHNLAIGPDFKLGNRLVHEAVKKYPNRFIGYAVINPNYPEDIENELDLCFRDYGMRAIKFHGELHKYALDGENYRRVLDFAESESLTILCHGLGKFKTLCELSSEYKNVNFLIAHYGTWDMRTLPEVIEVASKAPNVFLDSSGSVDWFGGFDEVVLKVGDKKMLFGSDFPWGNLPFTMGRVLLSRISDEKKRRILGENANAILRID